MIGVVNVAFSHILVAKPQGDESIIITEDYRVYEFCALSMISKVRDARLTYVV